MLLNKLKRSRLIKSSLAVLTNKILYTASAFIISVLAARTMGTDSYGLYVYAISWLTVLSIPAGLGMEGLLSRNIAAYIAKEQFSLAYGLIRWSFLLIVITSTSLGILAGFIAWWVHDPNNITTMYMLWQIFTVLPIFVLARQQSAVLQGMRQPALSQLPMVLGQIVLALVLLALYVSFSLKIYPPLMGVLYSVSWVFSLLLSFHLSRSFSRRYFSHTHPAYRTHEWTRSIPYFLISISSTVIIERTDLLMIGIFRSFSEVSTYSVALRGASLLLFLPTIISVVLAPEISRLFAKNDKNRLQQVVTLGFGIRLIMALPVAIIIVLFGRTFLGIYGNEFLTGYYPMIILVIGQFVVAIFHILTQTLLMTQHERPYAISIGVGACLNILLNLLLIPPFGMYGGAVATTASLICSTILTVWFVWKKLGILPISLPNIRS